MIRTANAHDLGFWGDGAQSGRGSSNKGAMRRGFVGSSQWVVGCRRPLQEMRIWGAREREWRALQQDRGWASRTSTSRDGDA